MGNAMQTMRSDAGSRAGLIPKSDYEGVIRLELCAFLRAELPSHVILHELPVGDCRADVAAVSEAQLLLFEIKSEKDTLSRLGVQMDRFRRASHDVVVIAHEKHFDQSPYANGAARMAWLGHGMTVWSYPRQSSFPVYSWRFPQSRWWRPRPPHPWHFLDLLQKEELVNECRAASLPVNARATRDYIIRAMIDDMTGRQITVAVCRQLRNRAQGDSHGR